MENPVKPLPKFKRKSTMVLDIDKIAKSDQQQLLTALHYMQAYLYFGEEYDLHRMVDFVAKYEID